MNTSRRFTILNIDYPNIDLPVKKLESIKETEQEPIKNYEIKSNKCCIIS